MEAIFLWTAMTAGGVDKKQGVSFLSERAYLFLLKAFAIASLFSENFSNIVDWDTARSFLSLLLYLPTMVLPT